MANQVQTTCENCGKPFMVDETRLKHGRGKNCSMECSYKSRSKKQQTRIKRTCARCGNEFETTPSVIASGHGVFCSRECCFPPNMANCENCGKEFRYSPSAKQKFCSKECADSSEYKSVQASQSAKNAWSNPESRIKLMDGIKRRSESDEWKNSPHFRKGKDNPRYKGNRRATREDGNRYEYAKWRKSVLKKDNYTCQECGKRGGRLEAHHIKEWANHTELRYDIGNGMALCEDCHIKIHNHYRKPISKICQHCGHEFRPSKTAQKFCNKKCFHDSLRHKP